VARTGAESSGSHPSWSRTLIAGLLVLVVVGIVVGAVVLASGGDDSASASEVFTEPISTAGSDPFAPAVGTDEQIPSSTPTVR
jgi:ABC-type uncharacterized transport system permease subunit